VFIGANGQGKTNLLEAVAMLALSSSPRARREVELVGRVAPGSRIEAEIEAGSTTIELAITLKVEGDRVHRTIEVDGIRRRAVDLPGHFRVTLFWPDDLGLVKSGPEPGYARALATLRRVLEQRNSLLKQIASGAGDEEVLEVWNQELVKVSLEIAGARSRAIEELRPVAARCHSEIGAGERLEIHYLGPPENLAEAVNKSLADDIRRGSTTVGPHRDDLLVLLDGQEARSYGSQGQQRTAVVSLKLAEAALIEGRAGERPVLLLDDVLSELDGERRAALLKEVGAGGQVIITSVEAGPFPPELIAQAMVWTVSEGTIEPCG
jgi:DNA replication and repair protein RecF